MRQRGKHHVKFVKAGKSMWSHTWQDTNKQYKERMTVTKCIITIILYVMLLFTFLYLEGECLKWPQILIAYFILYVYNPSNPGRQVDILNLWIGIEIPLWGSSLILSLHTKKQNKKKPTPKQTNLRQFYYSTAEKANACKQERHLNNSDLVYVLKKQIRSCILKGL